MKSSEMPRLLLTGVTGTLGSQILDRLASSGHAISCLVRNSGAADALEARQNAAHTPGRISFIRGDVRQPLAALSEADVADLATRTDCIIHCAASIEFQDLAKAQATNVEGVRNMLALATKLGVKRFCHVSTAYVAGDAAHFSEADADTGQKWRNAYEGSKHAGELLVRAWAAESDRRYTIFRPSILVACDESPLPAFDAYLAFARPLALAAARFRSRAGGDLPGGVTVSSDGLVRLPLHLPAKASATLNFVPVAWVADTILKLLRRSAFNRTYQLIHPAPPTVQEILNHTMRALGVEGIEIDVSSNSVLNEGEALRSGLGGLQEMLLWSLAAYLPYMNGEPVFSDANVREDLGPDYDSPPAINFDFLRRTIKHAEAKRWQPMRPGGPSRLESAESK